MESTERMLNLQMKRLDASISSITISLTQLETFLNSFSVAPVQAYESEHTNQARSRSQLCARRPDFKNLKVDGEGVKIIKNAALSQRYSQQSPNYQEKDFHSRKPSMSQTFNVWGDTVISHKSMEKLREQNKDLSKQYPVRPLQDRRLHQFLDNYSRIYEWLSNVKSASQLYNEDFFSDITVNNRHFAQSTAINKGFTQYQNELQSVESKQNFKLSDYAHTETDQTCLADKRNSGFEVANSTQQQPALQVLNSDNNSLPISNCTSNQPLKEARHYSQTEKERATVPNSQVRASGEGTLFSRKSNSQSKVASNTLRGEPRQIKTHRPKPNLNPIQEQQNEVHDPNYNSMLKLDQLISE